MDDPLAAARAALARGDAEGAGVAAERACVVLPESAEAWFLLGAVRHRSGVPNEALAAFERAAGLMPDASAIANARAAVLSELGRTADARKVLEAALRPEQPVDPQLLVNLAIALETLGEREAAARRYREALAAVGAGSHPAVLPALLNLGALLMREGRHEEALPVHRELVQRAPRMADALFNLAENLLALGQPEQALTAAEAALAIDPRHVFAGIDRAFALALLDRLHEAQEALRRARAIDPSRYATYRNLYDPEGDGSLEGVDARLLFLQWHYQRLVECDWSRYDTFVARCRTLLADASGWPGPIGDVGAPFRVLALPLPGSVHARLARSVGAAAVAAVQEQGIAPYSPARRDARRSRLRIGYVSPDFRRHPMAHLTRGLYAAHDRTRFEVIGYSLHPGPDDQLTREIEAGCDAFHRVAEETTPALVARIRDDGIDVLVDLAGHTANARQGIFAARAAPVQATWIGVPWTTGLPSMDYALVDRGGVPAGTEGFWSEALVFMPGSCYVSTPNALGPPPARAAVGLPERGFVFCCFNNTWKIAPHIFACWMQVLTEVPDGVLWLVGASAAQKENLRARAGAAGVDPQRLVFTAVVDHETHIARYLLADLFLDTPVYNAHTTALDALWAGVPVLTCPGEIMPSRVAATFLAALGVDEGLVVPTPEAYVARAVELARNRHVLGALRERIREACRASPIFDPHRSARRLEQAYGRMWQRHADGLSPASFDL